MELKDKVMCCFSFQHISHLVSSGQRFVTTLALRFITFRVVDEDGVPKFPILTRLVLSCLSVPHGNADVERTFSDLTNLLMKQCNCLTIETIDACLLVSGFMKAASLTCKTFSLGPQYLEAGFAARHQWSLRLAKQKADDEKAKAEMLKKKTILEHIAVDRGESSVRQALLHKEEEFQQQQNQMEEAEAASLMLEEYQKKMAALALAKKKLEKEKDVTQKRKWKLDEKIMQAAIAKAARQ